MPLMQYNPSLKPLTTKLAVVWLIILLFSTVGHSTSMRKPDAMDNEVTRYYSHLHWQNQPGDAFTVQLWPTINYTGKDSYDINGLSGKEHNTEVRTVPKELDILVTHLINNSNFFKVVEHDRPQFFAQVHIRGFDPIYAPADGNHWFNLGLAHIDRGWSLLNGDDQPAKVALNLVIYDKDQRPLLKIPVKAKMDSCERSEHPMTFGLSPYQTFFNGYAATAIGQSFIASINRALIEASIFFKNQPIQGTVIRVDQNDIYVNLGHDLLSREDQFELLYSDDPVLPPYPISRLEVEKTWPDMSLVNALDVKSANVLPGDRITLKRTIEQRKYVSVAGDSIICTGPRRERVADTD